MREGDHPSPLHSLSSLLSFEMKLFLSIAAATFTGLAGLGGMVETAAKTQQVANVKATTELTAQVASTMDAAHFSLLQAVEETGVPVMINPIDCYEGEMAGVYGFYSYNEALVICQENGGHGQLVRMSAEDLNTIRHEVVHLIQDLATGTLEDYELTTVYKMNSAFEAWYQAEVPAHRQDVVEGYNTGEDACEVTRNLEAEAETVAYSQTAQQVEGMLRQFIF